MRKNFWCLAFILCIPMVGLPITKGKKTPCLKEQCCCPEKEVAGCVPSFCPARIVLPQWNKNWPCTTFLKTSFLYWYAAQDGMTLATSGSLQSSTAVNLENGAKLLSQPFGFDPGFKVDLGFGYENWELQAEYTWVRQKTSLHSNAPTDNAAGGTGVWLMNDWFAQGIGSNNNFIAATSVSSDWHLGIDLLDITANYPYYRSKYVVVSPYAGLRAAWIRQSLQIEANVPSGALTVGQRPLTSQPIHSHNQSNSWGLGPLFGTGASCQLGSLGFRLEGQGNLALLFTQYTTLSHSEDSASSTTTPSSFSIEQENYNTVRPLTELSMGLGWGSYSFCKKYHIDLSAIYSFSVFWDQNMIRTLVDEFGAGVSSSNDLFLQGLTVTARFAF